MDIQIIVALIGLGGISLGALLSGFGYFLKVRSDKLKARKAVLFHLLEIRHRIKAEYANPEALAKLYISSAEDYIRRKGLAAAGPVDEQTEILIKGHFSNLTQAVKPSLDDKFLNSFQDAISTLSQDSPVLAYTLRGKEMIEKVLSAQRIYITSFAGSEVIGSIEGFRSAIEAHMNNLNNTVIEEIIKYLDSHIVRVANSCGVMARISVRSLLKETAPPELKFDTAEFDLLMDRALNDLAPHGKALNTGMDVT